MDKIAVIDMGSNSIRMVIFQVAEEMYHLIDDTKETVRLSEKMGAELMLKPQAMKRALATLTRFMKICRSRNVTTIIPITTAAVRQAKNQREFLSLVEQETGLRFRILTGHEEGYYGFLGIINSFAIEQGLTLDIGGGSSEVTFFTNRELQHSVSLPFGAITLTERFRDDANQLKQYLHKIFLEPSWIQGGLGVPLIGLGGTVRNIARIHRHLIGYPLESAHHYEMSKEQVDQTINHIASLSVQELQSLPGLSKDRADIILAGGLIVQTLMETSHSSSLLISGNGLREGLFFEYYYGDKDYRSGVEVTMSDVVNMMQVYNVDINHSRHVAFLAVRLFDELRALHNWGEREKQLLLIAAYLHDVGVAVSFYEWHKHTFYVLLHSKFAGLTHRERLLVAMLASFKNKKKMREFVQPYLMILKPEDEETITKLSILLLMARAFDRALSKDIVDVTCKLQNKEIQITAMTTSPDIDLELKEANEFQPRFEKAFGYKYKLAAQMVVS